MPHFISAEISIDERRSRAGMDGWAIGQTLVIARAAGALCLAYGSWGGHRRKPDREDAPADGAGRHHDWGATDGMTLHFFAKRREWWQRRPAADAKKLVSAGRRQWER